MLDKKINPDPMLQIYTKHNIMLLFKLSKKLLEFMIQLLQLILLGSEFQLLTTW